MLSLHQSSRDHLQGSVGYLCRRFTKRFTKLTGTIEYALNRYPQQMVQMDVCDLSHTFRYPFFSSMFFVILLCGILTPPLSEQSKTTRLYTFLIYKLDLFALVYHLQDKTDKTEYAGW